MGRPAQMVPWDHWAGQAPPRRLHRRGVLFTSHQSRVTSHMLWFCLPYPSINSSTITPSNSRSASAGPTPKPASPPA